MNIVSIGVSESKRKFFTRMASLGVAEDTAAQVWQGVRGSKVKALREIAVREEDEAAPNTVAVSMAKRQARAQAGADTRKSKQAIVVAEAAQQTNLHEVFLKALTEYYRGDHLAPGLVLAWLPERSLWYASIVRYPENGKKHVVVKVESDVSLNDAMEQVMTHWRGTNENLLLFRSAVLPVARPIFNGATSSLRRKAVDFARFNRMSPTDTNLLLASFGNEF